MNKPVTHPEYKLYEIDGDAFCSTLQLAEEFEKRHKDIIETVRRLISTPEQGERCKPYFRPTSFLVPQPNGGTRKEPAYFMSRDGFVLLTMGFTGKKALKFKLDYIARFNEMESFIKSLAAIRDEHPAFTEAVMLAHEEPKHYHFSNEIDMINRIVLGRPAKAIREEHGLPKGQSIRPLLSDKQLADIKALQMADVGMLATMPEFAARKSALESLHFKRASRLLAA